MPVVGSAARVKGMVEARRRRRGSLEGMSYAVWFTLCGFGGSEEWMRMVRHSEKAVEGKGGVS